MSLTYATQVHERLEKSIELPNIETIGWIDTLPNRFRRIGGTGPAIGVEAQLWQCAYREAIYSILDLSRPDEWQQTE